MKRLLALTTALLVAVAPSVTAQSASDIMQQHINANAIRFTGTKSAQIVYLQDYSVSEQNGMECFTFYTNKGNFVNCLGDPASLYFPDPDNQPHFYESAVLEVTERGNYIVFTFKTYSNTYQFEVEK